MLAALAEVFGEDLGEVRLMAYVQALDEWPLEALRAACQQAVREAQWFPKPVELRQYAQWAWGRAWRARCRHAPMCGTPMRCALELERETRRS